MDESFLQESLQHPGSKGRVPSNQRQLFLDQEIFDQQERHILHPVILTCVTLFDIVLRRELIKETRVALLTRTEISQMWHKPNLAVKGISIFFEAFEEFQHRFDILRRGSSSSLPVQPHGEPSVQIKNTCSQVLDYGTFGLWAALLAGGRIVLPSGFPKEKC